MILKEIFQDRISQSAGKKSGGFNNWNCYKKEEGKMTKLEQMLEQGASVVILGHINPDGDCMGSCLAMYNYVKKRNPEAYVQLYMKAFPKKFSYLRGFDQIQTEMQAEYPFDLCICLDCSDKERLGEFVGYLDLAKRSLCIDHHITNTGYAEENVVDSQASSTSEVLYGQLLEQLIDQDIAACLYTGIIHDSGVFRFSSTSARTMEIAGKLMETGIDFTKIIDDSFFKKTYLQSQILGRALMESIRFLDGKCIFSVVKRQDMEFYGVEPKDLDGIVDQLRTIEGIECAIFIYELDNHIYKVSMRSNYVVDVSKIASYFGGGGHVRAAGCTMSGSIHDVVNNLSEHIEKQLVSESKDD